VLRGIGCVWFVCKGMVAGTAAKRAGLEVRWEYIKETQTDKEGVRREWALLDICSLLRKLRCLRHGVLAPRLL